MNKSAKILLLREAIYILVTGSIIIITSMVSIQAYVSYQKSHSTKKLFLDEISRNSDQIFLFSKLNKTDELDNLLFDIKSNFKDITFCIKVSDASTITPNSCENNISDYNSTSFGPDGSITIFYRVSPFFNLANAIISTLMLSILYLLLFSFFIFKLSKKLSHVFADSLIDIVHRVNSIGNGERSIFNTKNQLIEINQIEMELNKLVLKLSDLETKIESRISKKYALQVAHDIRSPVGALKMLFSIINVNPESKGFAHLCLERIENIANDILNTQKNPADIGAITLTNLSSYLKNIENEFRIRYNLKNHFLVFNKIQFSTIDGNYSLVIPDHLLSRVIAILIQNTFDEFNEYNNLRISVDLSIENTTSVVISYSDNGPGFSQDVLDCLVNKKKYTTNKKSLYSGHGMGLTYLIETVNRYGRIKSFSNTSLSGGANIQFSLNLLSCELNPNLTTPQETPHVIPHIP